MPKFKKFGDLPVQTLMGHVGEDTDTDDTPLHNKKQGHNPKIKFGRGLTSQVWLNLVVQHMFWHPSKVVLGACWGTEELGWKRVSRV